MQKEFKFQVEFPVPTPIARLDYLKPPRPHNLQYPVYYFWTPKTLEVMKQVRRPIS